MEKGQHTSKPFLSFQAIHIPIQAPKAFIRKYKGIYDKGWDKLRL